VTDISLKIDPEVIIGTDVINRAGTICKIYGQRVLLASEKKFHENKNIERLVAILADSGVEAILFDEILPLSMADTAETIATLARAAHCSGIIGFGGLVIQAIARMAAIIASAEIDIFELLDGKTSSTFLPYMAIPSIKEDPFLLADNFIAIDPRDRAIRLVHAPRALCKAVIIDSDFSGQTDDATVAFDGFCIAVEAYCSKKANILSDPILEEAIGMYARIISLYVNGNANVREIESQAGFLVNIGSAVSVPGIGSALAYGIAGRFPVTKSLCATILLPAILDKLVSCRAEKMAKIARLMGEHKEGLSDVEAALLPAASIRSSLEKLNISIHLQRLGLALDRMVPITEAVRSLELVAFSPWTVTSEEILNIVKQSL
jgi:alcohol dehydrogenase